MRKKVLSILICLMFLVSPVFFAGCGEQVSYTVKYYSNRYFHISYQSSISTPIKTLHFVKEGAILEHYSLRTYIDYDVINDNHIYYNHVGWYLDTGCTQAWLETNIVTSNINLYAKWVQVTA